MEIKGFSSYIRIIALMSKIMTRILPLTIAVYPLIWVIHTGNSLWSFGLCFSIPIALWLFVILRNYIKK